MKKGRRVIAILLALTFSVFLFAGCGSTGTANATASEAVAAASAAAETAQAAAETATEAAAAMSGKNLETDDIKVAYVPISTAGIMNKMVIYAFNEVLKPYKNIKLDIFDPGYDTQTEITILNDCINQKYDAIICEITDAVSLATSIRNAEQAGIPVITINTTTEEVHSLHITGDDYLGGLQGAEAMANRLGADAGIKYVIIDVPPAMQESNFVAKGVTDYLDANTNWELLAKQGIENYSQEDANTAMRDLLTKYEDIGAVFCAIDDLTVGAVQAIDAVGRGDGSIQVWGHMGYPAAYDLLLSKNPSMAGLNWADMFNEYSYAMLAALNYIAIGYTAQLAGRTDTPQVLFATTPLFAEDVEKIYTITRWEDALAS